MKKLVKTIWVLLISFFLARNFIAFVTSTTGWWIVGFQSFTGFFLTVFMASSILFMFLYALAYIAYIWKEDLEEGAKNTAKTSLLYPLYVVPLKLPKKLEYLYFICGILIFLSMAVLILSVN